MKEKVLKVLLFLVKILRWPVVYYGVLAGGFYGIAAIFKALPSNEGLQLSEVIGKYGIAIGGILLGVIFLTSILSSSLFTDTFLASTGISVGLYLVASLFFTAPTAWDSSSLVEYDVMKMYVVLALAVAVLLGDIIVLIFRKILNKRSMRHMMEHT